MAEGWTRHLHDRTIDACSAGTHPNGLNRLAVAAMAEAGVDIAAHTSKTVDACDPRSLDLIVTVCGHAHEGCPVFSGGARVVHHGFDDLSTLAAGARNDEDALPHYRRVRDEIRSFVESLPELLGGIGAAAGGGAQ